MSQIREFLRGAVMAAVVGFALVAEADVYVTSAPYACPIDTRAIHVVTSLDELLPITYSGANWTNTPGTVTVSEAGQETATFVAETSEDGAKVWTPTRSGVYTFTHTSSDGVSQKASFTLPYFLFENEVEEYAHRQSGGYLTDPYLLPIDTRSLRVIESFNDLLPFTYSGSNWSDTPGTVTVSETGQETATFVGETSEDGTQVWTPTRSGVYTFTHTTSDGVAWTNSFTLSRVMFPAEQSAYDLDMRNWAAWSEKTSTPIDTRSLRIVTALDQLLPFTYSGSDWSDTAGTATIAETGAETATFVASTSENGTQTWTPTHGGVYTFTHDSTAGSAQTVSFTIDSMIFPDDPTQHSDGMDVAFDIVTTPIDTRNGTRTITSLDQLLPFTYSGANWSDASGSATVTLAPDGDAASTFVAVTTETGSTRWIPMAAGNYTFTHTSTADGATELSAAFQLMAEAIPPLGIADILEDDEGYFEQCDGVWTVVLTNDLTRTVLIPDNMGPVVFDLDGHTITAPNGTAGVADGKGSAGIVIFHDVDDLGPTELAIVDSSGTGVAIRGGDGADGNPAGAGCAAIEVADDANAGVTLDVGEQVSVIGGNGGTGVGTDAGGAGVAGGAGGAGVNAGPATLINNDGTIIGGDGGNGSDGTTGFGGRGGLGGSAVIGDNAAPEGAGTETRGNDGQDGRNYTSAPKGMGDILDEDEGVLECVNDTWTWVLTNNVMGPVLIPDNLGPVALDLNGYNITATNGVDGTTSTAGGNGAPAILVYNADGEGAGTTELAVVNSDSDDTSVVRGGNGGDGNPAGNGGAGIAIADDADSGVKLDVGDKVQVIAGNGGKGLGVDDDGNGTNGGTGGAGVDIGSGSIVGNDGAIIGGNGGDGSNGTTGQGGAGGNGGNAIVGGTANPEGTGTEVGGNGGNGGSSAQSKGGTGGTAGAGTDNTTEAPTNGSDGEDFTGRPDGLDDILADGDGHIDNVNGVWTLVLDKNVIGPVLIPDNLGPVALDLNGYNITATNGVNGTTSTAGGNGAPAILVYNADGEGAGATELAVVNGATGDNASVVRGGNGGDGNPAGNGGAGIAIADDADSGVKLDVGDKVQVIAGNGGKGLGVDDDGNGTNGGNGGAGVDIGSGTIVGNDGAIIGGNGGNGADGATGGTGGQGGAGGAALAGEGVTPSGSGTTQKGTDGANGVDHTLDIQVGADVWARVDDDGACTISGTGDMWDNTEWVGGNPLAVYKKTLKSVTFGDGLTSIGARAFQDFWGLGEVTIGASVTNVGMYAFQKCYGLTNVTSAATGAMKVGDGAFIRCNALETMSFAANPQWGEMSFKIQAAIRMENDKPVVYAIPAITVAEAGGLTEHILGKKKLNDAAWTDVTELSAEAKKAYHFFKIVLK